MKSTLLLILLVFAIKCSGQNQISFSGGVQITDMYAKPFYPLFMEELYFIEKNTTLTSFTFNLDYRFHSATRLHPLLGIGLNRKGFLAAGLYSDGTTYHFYPFKWVGGYTFINLNLGASWTLYKKVSFSDKTTSLSITEVITPEIPLNVADFSYKRLPISARTNIIFEVPLSQKVGLIVNPFFTTALFPYNKDKLGQVSSNWQPFGYGVELGFTFRGKKKA